MKVLKSYNWPLKGPLADFLLWQYKAGTRHAVSKTADGNLLYTVSDEALNHKNMIVPVVEEHESLVRDLSEARETVKRLSSYLDEYEAEIQSLQEKLKEKETSPSEAVEDDSDPDEIPVDILFDNGIPWFLNPELVPGAKISKRVGKHIYFRSASAPSSFTPKPVKAIASTAEPEAKVEKTTQPVQASKEEWTEVKGKSKAKASGKKQPTPPVSRENPLHVKGMPRTQALSESERKALRAALGLPDYQPLDPDVWNSLSSSAKTQYRKSTSIPHWAVTAVLRNKENLVLIEKKILTKNNLSSALKSNKPRREVKSAGDLWRELKKKYPKARLLARPQTAQEKALKRGYDHLVKEFGKGNPSLPKLSKAKVGGKKGELSLKGLDSILPMISIIGKIAKVFA